MSAILKKLEELPGASETTSGDANPSGDHTERVELEAVPTPASRGAAPEAGTFTPASSENSGQPARAPGIVFQELPAPRARGFWLRWIFGSCVLALIVGLGPRAYRWALEPGSKSVIEMVTSRLTKDPLLANYEAATDLLRRDQPELAIGAFEEMAKKHPTNIPVLLGLAIAQQKKGDPAKAEATLLAAMKASPGNAVVLNNLGTFYARTGKLEAGIQLLLQAKQLDSQHAEPLLNLAWAYETNEDWKAAVKFYESYLTHSARDPKWDKAVADRLAKIEPFSRNQGLIEDEDEFDSDEESEAEIEKPAQKTGEEGGAGQGSKPNSASNSKPNSKSNSKPNSMEDEG